MSDIRGQGYGSSHDWERGRTNQSPESYLDKFTIYKCLKCGAKFVHYYDIERNIFEAIKKAYLVEDKCEGGKKCLQK